jgi:hypothetical protein
MLRERSKQRSIGAEITVVSRRMATGHSTDSSMARRYLKPIAPYDGHPKD